MLFRFYYENGFVPLLLKGNELKELTRKISKDLKSVFLRQYDNKFTEKFDQLDNDRIILIIDDFHNCPIKTSIEQV